jgi:hypothetical protein
VTIQQRSLFGPADNAPSSGDGGDGATVPATGNRNPDYQPPTILPRQSTGGGDQDSPQTATERAGLTDAYSEARSLASTFVGSGASGVQIGRGEDGFATTGQTPDGIATTTGGEQALVTRTDSADRGDTGAGKAIG